MNPNTKDEDSKVTLLKEGDIATTSNIENKVTTNTQSWHSSYFINFRFSPNDSDMDNLEWNS